VAVSRSARLVAGASLGLVLLLAVAFLALHTSPVRRAILRSALAKLERSGIVGHADDLDYNLATLHVTLRGVTLATRDAPRTPFFTANAVAVTLGPGVLLGRVDLRAVDLDRAALNIERGVETTETANTELPSAIPVGTVHVRDLAVRWRDRQSGLAVDLSGISFDLLPTGGASSGGITVRAPGTIAWAKRSTVLQKVDGRVSWNGRDLSLERVLATFTEGDVAIDGRLSDVFRDPRIDLQIAADTTLPALARWVTESPTPTGSLHVTTTVTGTLANVRVAARVSAQVAEGRIRADCTVMSASGGGECHGEWTNVSVPALVPAAATRNRMLVPASHVTGSFDAQWERPQLDAVTSHGRMEIQADATHDRLSLSGPAEFALEHGRLSAHTVQDIATAARLRADIVTSLDARSVTQSTITGRASIAVADLARLASALARTGVATLPSGLGGAVDAAVTVDGTIADPLVAGTIDIAHGAIGPMQHLSARSDIRVTSRELRLDHAQVAADRNSARFDVRVALDSRSVDGRFTATVADPGAFVPDWSHAITTASPVRVSGTIGGRADDPQIAATVNGSNLTVAGQTIDDLQSDIAVRGRAIQVRRFTIASGAGRLTASGRADFGARTYSVEADAAGLPVSPIPESAGLGNIPVTTTIGGDLRGEGTFESWSGRAHLSSTDVRWADADVGAVTADAIASGDRVTIRADAAQLGAMATGEIGTAGDGPLKLHVDWNIADAGDTLRRLGVTLSDRVSGRATLAADVTGRRDRWRDSGVDVEITSLDALVDGRSVQLTRPSHVTYAGQSVQAHDLVFRSNRSTLSIDGSVGSSPGDRLTAVLDGSLEDLPLTGINAGGAVNVTIGASGSLTQPDLAASFRVSSATVTLADNEQLTGITLAGRYVAGLVTIDNAEAAYGDAVLRGHGQVTASWVSDALPANWRTLIPLAAASSELTLHVENVTPRAVRPWIAEDTLADLDGRIDADVSVRADRPSLDRLDGSITLSQARVSASGIALEQQRPTRLRVRDGRVEVEAWEWGEGDQRLSVAGGVTLDRDPRLGLDISSSINLRTANAFIRPAAAAGRVDARLKISGTIATPVVDGFATFADGEVRLQTPRLAVTDLSGTVTFNRDTLRFERLYASVNGGDSDISGELTQHGWRTFDGAIAMVTRGAAVDLSGLRAEVNADLAWRLTPDQSVVSGTATLLRGAYRENLSLTTGLLAALAASASSARVGPPSALDATELDIRILTEDDVQVRNNYLQVAVSGDLRIVGTIGEPGVVGRATVADGGLLFFGGNRYRLTDAGTIDFEDPTRIEPSLDLKAATQVRGTNVTLNLKGTPDTLTTSLTSDDPTLSEADLVSLLVSGRTSADAGTAGFVPGSTELLGYLSGELFDVAGRAVGLDTVRVERGTPNVTFDAGLVATETDPGTRLTFGKTIRGNVQVIFSQSLRETDGLTWIVSYAPRSDIELRVVSLDNRDRLYAFQHSLVFGGPPVLGRRSPAPEPPRVGDVQIAGAGTDEPELRSRLQVRPGDRFDAFAWQDDRDRLEAFLRERGYAEARITARRTTTASGPVLTYGVDRGPRTRIIVHGVELSRTIEDAIQQAWQGNVADPFLVEETTALVKRELADQGFLAPAIDAHVQRAQGDEKQLVIDVMPGRHSRVRRVVFQGNAGLSRRTLEAAIGADLRVVWLEPDQVQKRLLGAYRDAGYLDASVRIQPIQLNGDEAVRTIGLTEGPRFTVRTVAIDGVRDTLRPTIAEAVHLSAGQPFSTAILERARTAADRAYRARGFNNVTVTIRAVADAPNAAIDVQLTVAEGPQQRLRDLVIAGVNRTKPALVSRALGFEIGQPVNLAEWNRARQRLYETGAFRRVDLVAEPIADAEANPSTPPSELPVRANVTVEEWPPLRLRYGLEVTDQAAVPTGAEAVVAPREESTASGRVFGAGVAADVGLRNLFGHAVSAGVAGRYTRGFRALRAYTTSPSFFGLPITSNGFLSRSREEFGGEAGPLSRFTTDLTSLTLEQRMRKLANTEIAYGYTFERNRTFDLRAAAGDPTAFDVPVNIGRLYSTVVVDTRNDLVDATRGGFHSSAFVYGPPALGSDQRFVKYVVQQRLYRTAGAVVLASAVRLGVATAFDQGLIPIERFFAGGGNSVRGYAEDSLTPRDDFFGDPVGGNALLVLNQEIRFPLVKIVRGIAFVDAGRAFETIGTIRLRDLSVGVGGGLRIVTPVALVRIDFGVPLDRNVSRSGRLIFSIGQAF
jgi:outer membrane protein assembly factor BamA/autotransporter translocation and assembly factor TamB